MQEIFERLVAANIQLLPLTELPKHFVFERDGFIALVERHGESFGPIGSAGLLHEGGFAALYHKNGKDYFITRTTEQEATPEQVASLKQFSHDLKVALGR
jgi:hypothetical protein